MENNRKDPRRQLIGAVSKALGQQFERDINAAFDHYRRLGVASIEKTPEPFHMTGRENGGIPQDEATLPGPISAYGSTKLMGEKYVEQFCHRHFIVRTAWLYSYYGKNFVKTIVNAGRKFGKLEVVNDQCGNPTNAVDLAHELLQLCVTHEYGLYHCTGEGICSWYDFASEIIRLSGVDASVAPCTSEEYKAKHPESADRPKWSALDNRMLRCTVGNDVRDWKDALACFFTNWDGENGMK